MFLISSSSTFVQFSAGGSEEASEGVSTEGVSKERFSGPGSAEMLTEGGLPAGRVSAGGLPVVAAPTAGMFGGRKFNSSCTERAGATKYRSQQ